MIDFLKKLYDRSIAATDKYRREQDAPDRREMPRNDQYLRDGFYRRERFDSRD